MKLWLMSLLLALTVPVLTTVAKEELFTMDTLICQGPDVKRVEVIAENRLTHFPTEQRSAGCHCRHNF